jgi:hypothetical protein
MKKGERRKERGGRRNTRLFNPEPTGTVASGRTVAVGSG